MGRHRFARWGRERGRPDGGDHRAPPRGVRVHPELVPADDDGLYLHATLEGSGTARVALIGHHDTVFPAGTAAARPFSRDASRCYGPGVADMKGGLVVAAHAARLLALGDRPFARLEVVSCPDEESRPSAPATIDRLRRLRRGPVPRMRTTRRRGRLRAQGAWWTRVHALGHPAHAGVEPDTGRNAVHASCDRGRHGSCSFTTAAPGSRFSSRGSRVARASTPFRAAQPHRRHAGDERGRSRLGDERSSPRSRSMPGFGSRSRISADRRRSSEPRASPLWQAPRSSSEACSATVSARR